MTSIDLAAETRSIIQHALRGDPALASLAVAVQDAETLTATVASGLPPRELGGGTWTPAPFRREILVELVVRMQRYRAGRILGGVLLEPERDDLMRVIDSYPRACYPNCGPGWTDLLHALLAWTDETDPGNWRLDDIKEKYGTVRLYYSGPISDLGSEIIDAADHLSGSICDRCGRPGRTGGRGWISTRCEHHDGDWR